MCQTNSIFYMIQVCIFYFGKNTCSLLHTICVMWNEFVWRQSGPVFFGAQNLWLCALFIFWRIHSA